MTVLYVESFQNGKKDFDIFFAKSDVLKSPLAGLGEMRRSGILGSVEGLPCSSLHPQS